MFWRLTALVALISTTAWPSTAFADGGGDHGSLRDVNHIVVIYEENHSFDNLYGGWEGVNGLSSASTAKRIQITQGGVAYACLLQNDVNLTSPPQPVSCVDSANSISSYFSNAPFTIDNYIAPTDTTCPAPGVFAPNGVAKGSGLPGGCTRDLVHRFYQEPYQLNGGAQNRYVTGSDAVGLSMGVYNTQALPIYAYLHHQGHPDYAIADNFFQAAFGGSFLNHQWLVAARDPKWVGALNDGSADDLHSVVDSNGMPNNYPLYVSPAGATVKDQALTASCNPGPGRGPTPPGVLCGNFAVNTIQPAYQPFAPGTPVTRQLPPQTAPTIGDRLSQKGVSWAWYSGGWSNANGNVGGPGWTNGSTPGTCTDPNANAASAYPNCPDKLFQFHHQPLNYYASFAPGTAARANHLRDEAQFISLAQSSTSTCNLKSVSFIKPIGEENEHPGYSSENSGSTHLVNLLTAIEGSACAKDTMVVVTYDEFGGQWDHVAPPGQGNNNGPHDINGPGTRIPALVIWQHLRDDFVVDSTPHDTTSILATIEHRFDVKPLTARDAAVKDLSTVFRAEGPDDWEDARST
jgi:acid phosphatase